MFSLCFFLSLSLKYWLELISCIWLSLFKKKTVLSHEIKLIKRHKISSIDVLSATEKENTSFILQQHTDSISIHLHPSILSSVSCFRRKDDRGKELVSRKIWAEYVQIIKILRSQILSFLRWWVSFNMHLGKSSDYLFNCDADQQRAPPTNQRTSLFGSDMIETGNKKTVKVYFVCLSSTSQKKKQTWIWRVI